METAHNLLMEFLWARGFAEVYVVPPGVVSSSRGRFRQSGANSDEYDAMVIADLLRTDRQRLYPWHPDSLLTQQIRADISYYRHLTKTSTQQCNRLRSVLLRYYPAALKVFSSLKTQIMLQFLQCYPTPKAAKALTYAEFETFAREQGYARTSNLPACFARLQASHPQATEETMLVYQNETVQLAQALALSQQQRKETLHRLRSRFDAHPDAAIFASMPGVGDFLAPALLSKFGDDRQRFPTAATIQALAGTCPVTRQSGKRKSVRFRHACDKEFRHIAQQWARFSLTKSVWANTYCSQLSSGNHSQNHAFRCLANRWLAILWKCWQTHRPYDEAYHMRQRALRSRPR
jgi:transposase